MWYPSKYGADDILGAMNLMTPETILSALSIVRRGIVYDLSHDLDKDMPIPGFHGAFFANTQFTLENSASTYPDRRKAAPRVPTLAVESQEVVSP
jgi:hypothetical protein